MGQKANHLKGVYSSRESSCIPLAKPASSVPVCSLKCLYTSACSMGNKQEELEICVQLQGHDLIAITETWWDSLHDWNVVTEGCELLCFLGKIGWRGGVVELLFM